MTNRGPRRKDFSRLHAGVPPYEAGTRYSPDDVQRARTEAHYDVHFANLQLVGRRHPAAVYWSLREALDEAVIALSRGKWFAGRATGLLDGFVTGARSSSDLSRAYQAFARASQLAWAAFDAGVDGVELQVGRSRLRSGGTEIQFAGSVPLVPSICPAVLLQGSSRDMGVQYAQQVTDIFGTWVLGALAGIEVSRPVRDVLGEWHAQLEAHAPELIDMADGIASGLRQMGIPTTREQAMCLWTGTHPPTRLALSLGLRPGVGTATSAYAGNSAQDICSGCGAWGEATRGGDLFVGATTDHDCTFQATLAAFPDEGHSFVYTPFSANGFIPVLGDFYMAGHPGMNDRGLAYVHHGGGSHTGEPQELWGYGLRRGASTMHILRYHGSARAARDFELSLPLGDGGRPLGNQGGFYADRDYGYVLESPMRRPDAPHGVIREHSYDADGREYDFLYATNNAQGPLSGGFHCPPDGGYRYDVKAGWYTTDSRHFVTGTAAERFRRWATKNSAGRNRTLFDALSRGYGRIDLDYMHEVFATTGDIPAGGYDEVATAYERGGEWECSSAHRGNAFVATMHPTSGDEGIYRACIGPARRSVATRDPSHGYYYADETNRYWDLRLAGTPEKTLDAARESAHRYAQLATEQSEKRSGAAPPGQARFLREARRQISLGARHAEGVGQRNRNESLRAGARALRAYLRAQVRAQQAMSEEI